LDVTGKYRRAQPPKEEARGNQAALHGLWLKWPAADKPKEETMVLRLHGDTLAICELKQPRLASCPIKLKEEDGKRLLIRPKFGLREEKVIAELCLDGDTLILSGEPVRLSEAAPFEIDVAGKWKRAR